MAHAPSMPEHRQGDRPRTGADDVGRLRQVHPVTPGKVALWLFLATEVMFFTGLIGSYIVLRAGSPPTAYSNLFPPGSPLAAADRSADYRGLRITSAGDDPARVAAIVAPIIAAHSRLNADQIEHLVAAGHAIVPGMPRGRAELLVGELESAGARVEPIAMRTDAWPRPYDTATNPLSIDLTAVNTFILICSSLTMVLALSAIQRGQRWRLVLYLGLTLLIGGTFLGIQVYEYRQLMFEHLYPQGISPTGHFTPDVSLFASCFFTMTGFHGAHVAAGLVALTVLFLRALFGSYTRGHHSPVELVGLYWHFVDLVWIILFTVVYLI